MPNNNFYVYAHITQDTQKIFYIGKGHGGRAWAFYHRNKFWKCVAKAHGVVVRLLKDNLSEQDAFILEQQMIAELGRRDSGCGYLVNMTNGGEGMSGYKPTPEVLEKKSKALRGRKLITVSIDDLQRAYDEGRTLQQVADKMQVCMGTVLKYVLQDPTRKYVPSTAFKKGQLVWNKGSDGAYMSGSNNPFYGKTHGQDTRIKMALKKCKPVACLETGAVYGSTLECAEQTGYSQSYVSRSARGAYQKIQTAHFKYV